MNLVNKAIKIGWSNLKKEYYYQIYRFTGNDYHIDVNIMSIDETLDFMSIPGNSIVRYGDGEFSLMLGGDIGRYQSADKCLAARLKSILQHHSSNLLICLPEPFTGVEDYVKRSKKHWILHNKETNELYRELVDRNEVYGNSFVSRPYLIYEDKNNSARWFERIKKLFADNDIVIIEGKYSRTGVGNDLLDGARSIQRILCPPNNAFNVYNDILKEAETVDRDKLVLVALGPTGKILTEDLANLGYWVLDIGHIDSEYEWYKMGATKKVAFSNKHSAEHNDSKVEDCNDADYLKSIKCSIGL